MSSDLHARAKQIYNAARSLTGDARDRVSPPQRVDGQSIDDPGHVLLGPATDRPPP